MGFLNGFSRRADADSAARQKRRFAGQFLSLKVGFGRNGRAPETRLRRGVCRLRLTRSLERFRAKWMPVRVKKTRQNKR
jgi:hypothetical protein